MSSHFMFTEEGFLKNGQGWTPELAQEIAIKQGITLTKAHWQVIHFVREFYARHQTTPPLRVLVSLLRETYGPEQGSSVYLQNLFPPSAALTIARIAGLPKPAKCI